MQRLRRHFGPKFQFNTPLKDHTTLKIGGPAKGFIAARTGSELLGALILASEGKLPFLVIGGGSNLLAADEGVDQLIIKNQVSGLASRGGALPAGRHVLRAYGGTSLQELVNFSIREGCSGLHKLTGIPGTVGGAIFGNAGAYGQTISDHLTEVIAFNPQNKKVLTLNKNEAGFTYRHSNFKNNGLIILEASFSLPVQDPQNLAREAREVLADRTKKYPLNLRCPGSFFKNIPVENVPPEARRLVPSEKIVHGKIPAGYLLEAVGAKGEKIGQIQVAESHGNLLINLGEGKAADFHQLAQNLAFRVKQRFGITLEPEVQLLGLPPIWS